MNYPLAIAAPQVGARSETFIRRHMEDLLPKSTAILTYNTAGPYAGHWKVDTPLMICSLIPPIGFRGRVRQELKKRSIRRFLKQHQVQVILGEYLNFSFNFFQLAQEFNIPYFAHAHGYDVSGALREPQWQKDYLAYRKASGIITMSQISRERLINLGLEPEKIHVVPYGVDVPKQPYQRVEKESIRCLAVGRTVAKKAPIFLLEAFRQAVRVCPNLHLDYIGTGPLMPAMRQFIDVFDLSSKITLHGGQSSETVQQFMREADIFLQHSMTDPESGDEEGLPVSILEAMSAALPVVSTLHAGIPEAVKNNETGFLVPEGDCASMTQGILALAQNIELRSKMGFAGWQRAGDRFTWDYERDTLLKILGFSNSSDNINTL